jgi:hypothetical protein
MDVRRQSVNDERAFELTLDEALQMLAAGAARDECLARFPEYAADLAPLLDAAQVARAGLLADQPIPAPDLSHGRRRFLLAARSPRRFAFGLPQLATAFALVLALIFVSVPAASASALPGDLLYPVKRGLEGARLALTFDPEARANLRADIAARRRAEARAVIDLKRETRVEFEGIVESVAEQSLVVSGLAVRAERAQEFRVGDPIGVTAITTADGLIVAERIEPLAPPLPAPPTETPTLAPAVETRASSPPTPARPEASSTPIPLHPAETPTPARPTETRAAPATETRPAQASPTPERPGTTPTPALPTESRPTLPPTGTPPPDSRPTDAPTPQRRAP